MFERVLNLPLNLFLKLYVPENFRIFDRISMYLYSTNLSSDLTHNMSEFKMIGIPSNCPGQPYYNHKQFVIICYYQTSL